MESSRRSVLATACVGVFFLALPAYAQTVPGDIDLDRDVDLNDALVVGVCTTEPGGGPVDIICQRADIDADNDVDLVDWAILQRNFGFDEAPPRIERLTPFPGAWVVSAEGLTTVEIGFSEKVTIPTSAVTLWTVGGGAISGFTLNNAAPTDTLTINLDPPIRDDHLTIVLDYTIVDRVGLELDGEVSFPANALLPSGNRVRGGQAVFRINVLQGDANRDGTVDALDLAVIQASSGLCSRDLGFDPNADLNGDGCVNVLDTFVFQAAEGRSLPPTDGAPPTIQQLDPDPATGLTTDLSQMVATFAEAVSLSRFFNARTLFITQPDDNIVSPASATLAPDGLSATYTFDPPLTQCGTYSINISNALADASGEFLTVPQDLPSITTSTVPPDAPSAQVATTMTGALTVGVSGSAPGASQVEVSGPGGVVVLDVVGDAFMGDAPLHENRVNQLFFTSIAKCGTRSAPSAIAVTHDATPPNLFIDFPPDGAEVTLNTIDVAGRVGDMLSGFMGLTVTVNGVPAEVDIGFGTNGTFFLPSVPLLSDQPTVIEAVATDDLGNTATKTITVTSVPVPPDEATMVVVSGNAQTGPVNTELPTPLVVRLENQLGTPFENKIVTFEVTRSDGRLQPVAGFDCTELGPMTLQCRTDTSGEVNVLWTLGSDAGCGNNRIEVTSESVVGSTFFCATALAAPARQINIGSGNNQRVEVGAPACEPLRVWVNDSLNGVAGVPVTFSVTQGSGAVHNDTTSGTGVTVMTDPTGHAEVSFTLGAEPGNQRVQATFPGNAGMQAEFVAFGLERIEDRRTSFSGLVLSNANQQIQGVVCTLTVGGVEVGQTTTDIDGRFRFDDVPDGSGRLEVNGLMATHIGGDPGEDVPEGSFPSLGFDAVLVANADNSLPTPILLPPLDPNNWHPYSTTQDTELTIDGIARLKFTVKGGSMSINGKPAPDGTLVSLNQVHFDDIPMPLPDGSADLLAWTLQPSGAKFDPPVQIQFPNTLGQSPGATQNFVSFNRATNRFEIVGTGTVSEDGQEVVSDPDSGISIAGWGCRPVQFLIGGCLSDCTDQAGAAAKAKEVAKNLGDAGTGFRGAKRALKSLVDLDDLLALGSFATTVSTAIKVCTPPTKVTPNPFFNPVLCDELIAGVSLAALAARGAIKRVLTKIVVLNVELGKVDFNLARALVNLEELGAICAALDIAPGVLKGIAATRSALSFMKRIADAAFDKANVSLANLARAIRDLINRRSGAAQSIAQGTQQTLDEILKDLTDTIGGIGELESDIDGLEPVETDVRNMITEIDTNPYNECSVSVGGQTVSPQPTGAYQVSNVPALGNLVRVDVICQSGDTEYGRSFYFMIPANGIIEIEGIGLSETPPPATVKISVQASPATLTSIDQVAQMLVLGELSDGSTDVDLSTQAAGTTYRSSNTNIVTVGIDGLATAIGPGTALVTTTNEGATAVTQVTVTLGVPLTTIEGFVVSEAGTPVADARVFLLGLGGEAMTDAAGHFEIPGVATDQGDIAVVAVFDNGTETIKAVSAAVAPVPDAVTDAGIIKLDGRLVIWLNPSGGNWNDPGNWHTGAVPGPLDTVLITLPGSYTVTLASNVQIAGLVLGASTGSQELLVPTVTLTTNSLAINEGGVLRIRSNNPESTVDVTGGGDVINRGLIHFDTVCAFIGCCPQRRCDDGPGASTLRVMNGTLINLGIIRSKSSGNAEPANGVIAAALDNAGEMDVFHPLRLSEPTEHRNSGDIRARNTFTIAGTLRHQSGTLHGSIACTGGGALQWEAGGALDAGLALIRCQAHFPADFMVGAAQSLTLWSSDADGFQTLTVDGTLSMGSLSGGIVPTLTVSETLICNGPVSLANGEINTPQMTLNNTMNVSFANASQMTQSAINGSLTNGVDGLIQVIAPQFGAPGPSTLRLTVSDGLINRGQINLTQANNTRFNFSGAYSALAVTNGTLVNEATGAIRSLKGSVGGKRFLEAELDNRGTLTLSHPLTISSPDSSTNRNSGLFDINQSLTLNQPNGMFINEATGVLDLASTFTVNGGTCDDQGTIVGNPALFVCNP